MVFDCRLKAATHPQQRVFTMKIWVADTFYKCCKFRARIQLIEEQNEDITLWQQTKYILD